MEGHAAAGGSGTSFCLIPRFDAFFSDLQSNNTFSDCRLWTRERGGGTCILVGVRLGFVVTRLFKLLFAVVYLTAEDDLTCLVSQRGIEYSIV